MTKAEFLPDCLRLHQGFRVEPTEERIAALYQRLQHVHPEDWTAAVTALLCEPRYPLLDRVFRAIEEAMEVRRLAAVERERQEAARWFAGRAERPVEGSTEYAYGLFRADLLRRALTRSLEQPGVSVSALVAEGLGAWLDDPANATWARGRAQADCPWHAGPHSLLQCITDEIRYYSERAAGRSPAEALAAIRGVAA